MLDGDLEYDGPELPVRMPASEGRLQPPCPTSMVLTTCSHGAPIWRQWATHKIDDLARQYGCRVLEIKSR